MCFLEIKAVEKKYEKILFKSNKKKEELLASKSDTSSSALVVGYSSSIAREAIRAILTNKELSYNNTYIIKSNTSSS